MQTSLLSSVGNKSVAGHLFQAMCVLLMTASVCAAGTRAAAATCSIPSHSVTLGGGAGTLDHISYTVNASWQNGTGLEETSACYYKVKYYNYSGVLMQYNLQEVATQGAAFSPVNITINPTFSGWDHALSDAPSSGCKTAVYYYYYHAEVHDGHGTVYA